MAVAVDPQPTLQHDPAFGEAMSHLHRGEWPRAIQGFQALQGRYPNNPTLARQQESPRRLRERRVPPGRPDRLFLSARRGWHTDR